MIDNLIDIISSLTLIMEEETARLTARDRGRDLAELAAAKLRLVGVLEAELARFEREQDGWADRLDQTTHDRLFKTLFALGEASTANAGVLERQIDLSVEMIGAIASEAKRLAGRSTTTYGARGCLSLFDPATPISINSEY
ncbi:MAG TPA: flagellar biosynthesis protein FlgN [Sphingomonadaceae bacterium]|nr:flagellar biosynthesis protein FlgN [Sphingomonadaceae bacterium]